MYIGKLSVPGSDNSVVL